MPSNQDKSTSKQSAIVISANGDNADSPLPGGAKLVVKKDVKTTAKKTSKSKVKSRPLATEKERAKPSAIVKPVAIRPFNEQTEADIVKEVLPAVASTPITKKGLTVGEQIWDHIKDRELGIFGLVGQRVSDYCKMVSLDPNKCFLTYKVSAVITSLETVAPEYSLETMGKYVILTRKVS